MYQYTCGSKYCATCSCWSGERKSAIILAQGLRSAGKCMNQMSGAWRQTRQANEDCSAHEKWGALR